MYIPEIVTHILTHPKLEDLKTQYPNIRYWKWRDYKNFLNSESAAAPQCGGRRVAETGKNVAKSVLKSSNYLDVFQKYYYVRYLNSKSHDLPNLDLSGRIWIKKKRRYFSRTSESTPSHSANSSRCILNTWYVLGFFNFCLNLIFFVGSMSLTAIQWCYWT